MGFSPETYAIIAGKGGKANGFATLNENGKVPASQIPSTAAPITSDTETTLTGVLTGNGSKVGSKAIDTSSLTDDNDHIPSSSVVNRALNGVVSVGGTFNPAQLASEYHVGYTLESTGSGDIPYAVVLTLRRGGGRTTQIAIPQQGSSSDWFLIRSSNGAETAWLDWVKYQGSVLT